MEWKEYTANLLPSFSFFLEKKDETWIAFSKKWTYFGCKKMILNQSSLHRQRTGTVAKVANLRIPPSKYLFLLKFLPSLGEPPRSRD